MATTQPDNSSPTTQPDNSSPISINAIAQLPIKLTFKNYPLWRAQFDALLTGFELTSYIDGSASIPSKEIDKDGQLVPNPAYNYWVRQDKLILHAICASTSESVLPFIFSAATSSEAWKKLLKLYANKTLSRVMHLKNILTYTRQDYKPVGEYLQQMKHIADELLLAGAALDEDDLILHTLNGVGVEYREISAAIRARQNPISFDELHDKLTAFELYMKKKAGPVPLAMGRLKEAAQAGDINKMYDCIREEEDALRWIDEPELVDTPLHIAADHKDRVDFAMAMMYLKPSWGSKLNRDMYSPMHLAVRKGHTEVVLGLLAVDKDLVRVKGREGFTALHYAAEAGDINLLAQFLKDCPECIEDVTIQNETALHVAAKNGNLKALEILARFLHRTDLYCRVSKRHLLDSKDRNGDTVLHVAASNTQPEMVKLLLECKVNTKEKNNRGLTAFNLLEAKMTGTPNREICLTMMRKGWTILHVMGIGAGDFIRNYIFFTRTLPTLDKKLRFKVTSHEKVVMLLMGKIETMSADKINALLVVLTLILTTTYQALLSPPGGVWQGDYSPNTTLAETHVGQSVMDPNSYFNFFWLNHAVFLMAAFLTVGCLEIASGSAIVAMTFEILLSLLMVCFMVPQQVIAPATNFKSHPSEFELLRYMLLASALYLALEIYRRCILFLFNPPAVRFYKKFFGQM